MLFGWDGIGDGSGFAFWLTVGAFLMRYWSIVAAKFTAGAGGLASARYRNSTVCLCDCVLETEMEIK